MIATGDMDIQEPACTKTSCEMSQALDVETNSKNVIPMVHVRAPLRKIVSAAEEQSGACQRTAPDDSQASSSLLFVGYHFIIFHQLLL